MTISTSLARMYFVGKVCKLGAWIIAGMGLIAILAIYIASSPFSDGSGNGVSLNNVLTTLAIAFLLAIPVIFFCLILYAVGVILTYLSIRKGTQQGAEQESDEFVEIITIPKL